MQENDNSTRTWEEAITYCENLVDHPSTYSDWRLPDEFELLGIVDYGTFRPSIDRVAFPNTDSSNYWSSTTYADTPSGAWFVSFGNGGVYYGSKAGSYVRCVRGGQ